MTVLTVFVGTFGVGFISNLQLYMIESMDGDYLSASPAEARIYVYPMDDDSVKIASEIPGVDAVEGSSITNVQVLRPDGENIAIQFTAVKNPNDLMVDTLQPAKNESSIPPLSNGEVLIDVSASSLGYQPGDLLTVELSNGRRRELRVAGYLHDATGVPYSQANMITAFVTPNTIKWLGGNLDYQRYRWSDRHVIRFIMTLTGGPTDLSTNVEYTDWDEVRRFAGCIADLAASRVG